MGEIGLKGGLQNWPRGERRSYTCKCSMVVSGWGCRWASGRKGADKSGPGVGREVGRWGVQQLK